MVNYDTICFPLEIKSSAADYRGRFRIPVQDFPGWEFRCPSNADWVDPNSIPKGLGHRCVDEVFIWFVSIVSTIVCVFLSLLSFYTGVK